jgi:hypothetical protein
MLRASQQLVMQKLLRMRIAIAASVSLYHHPRSNLPYDIFTNTNVFCYSIGDGIAGSI